MNFDIVNLSNLTTCKWIDYKKIINILEAI